MLRYLIPRSVIGVGVWFGILIFVPLIIGHIASLIVAQVIETGQILILMFQVQAIEFIAELEAIITTIPPGLI